MAPPAFELQALTAADADAYNAFLLHGVEQHPDTLRISPNDIAATPFKTEHGTEGSTFVSTASSGGWLGVVTIEREGFRDKRRHIAWVLRMYVCAEASGAGVGRADLDCHDRPHPGAVAVAPKPHGEAEDHAGRQQPVDAVLHRATRHAQPPCQRRSGKAGIVAEERDQLPVGVVEGGHWAIRHPNLAIGQNLTQSSAVCQLFVRHPPG